MRTLFRVIKELIQRALPGKALSWTEHYSSQVSSFSSMICFCFRRNPCRTNLWPHKRLEIIEKRLHSRKDLHGMVGKIRAEHLLIAEGMVDHELLMPDQFDFGIIDVISSRCGLEFFAGYAAKIFPESRGIDHPSNFAGIAGYGGADWPAGPRTSAYARRRRSMILRRA